MIMQVNQTYRGSVEYRLLMLCHLQDRCLVSRLHPYELAMRTFHYYLHVIDQAMNNFKSLRNCHLRLLEGESIEP